MVDYITQNPQFIIDGFVHTGITLDDRSESDVPEQDDVSSTTSDSDEDGDENNIVDYIVL